MFKKLVLMLALGLCLVAPAKGLNIIWVCTAIDNSADGVQDDAAWIPWLQSLGHTVDVQIGYWGTLDSTKIATLNAADVIVISRAMASDSTSNGGASEIAQWNAIKTPIISLNAYNARNSRNLWLNTTTINSLVAPLMSVQTPSHPIFKGITLDASSQVAVVDGTTGTGQTSFIGTQTVGNGTLLAVTATGTNTWIAEWKPGTPFYTGSGDALAGKRLLFCAGTQEVGATSTGAFNLTDAGKKMFNNALYYMAGRNQDPVATNPQPGDKATDVARDVVLAWKPGPSAATHDVYFGTSFADVNTATRAAPGKVLVSMGQDANTYDPPGVLQLGQTYYWRIDEINAPPSNTVVTGSVWSFTAEPQFYTVTGITATASSNAAGNGPEQTINGSGLDANNLHSATNTAMWLTAKGTTLPAWIQYDLGRIRKVETMTVWNYNGPFEDVVGSGAMDVTVEYSTDGASWSQLSGVPQFEQGTGVDGLPASAIVNFGGKAVRFVKLTITANWGGVNQTGLSEVRFMQTIDYARTPVPADKATGVGPALTLSWRSGRQAASANVYVGTDPNVLTLSGTTVTNSFAPANLSLGTTYYWKVDEVNTAEATTTWTGDTWSFTTPAFLTVDDIESYNDTTNKLYEVWIDGYNTGTNGAVVGYNDSGSTGTFGSTTIFHAGKQSMPFAYGTGGITTSEATRTFATAQDWTTYGVKTLTLYFYGQATNATNVPLYFKLTDQNGKSAKVVFGGAAGEDPIVLADPAWTAWNIPLTAFTGVTQSKIKSLTIGAGTGSGSGTLYIDDIRLYPTTPAAPVAATLVGWWKFDNNVLDSTTNGNNGTIVGTPTYVATGKIGASLKLNGTTDYVTCGNGASLNMTDTVTLAAWIKPATFANSAYQTIISKGDHAYVLAHTSGNLLQLAIYDGTWYSANSVAVTTAINGAWHHVAGTYDGAQVKVYLDGKLAGSTLRTGIIATETVGLTLGTNGDNLTTRLLNGEMDDARVYHGVLSTSDISKLANP